MQHAYEASSLLGMWASVDEQNHVTIDEVTRATNMKA